MADLALGRRPRLVPGLGEASTYPEMREYPRQPQCASRGGPHRAQANAPRHHHHQFPHYPGTGRVDELGVGDAVGFNCNLPLPAGCGDEEYLRCFDEVILPAVRRFRAQFLFVSAGFDAHWRDPLAAQQISGRGYRPIAERLRGLAQELGMPTLYMLEGGYDLEAVAWAVREVPAVGHGHHKVLMEGCQLAVATAPR